ncbi:DUF3427 domain-containing protein [Tepidibacillus marianensis]|uniref:DUF3427 domain-containing protein n=1 Tax=Tepidibacillus marianensis TaxID=3131995 RepID=UPI0030CB8964
MKNGIYEQVINRMINEFISKSENDKAFNKEPIDPADKNNIFAEYAGGLIRNKFKQLRDDEKVEALNKIIDLLSSEVEDDEIKEYLVEGSGELLLEVKDKKPVNSKIPSVRSITSIARSSLFTGSKVEPTLYGELKKEILSSDRIDILVSFIKYSGLRLLMDEFKEFTQTKKLRIITTSYMGASDYKAIKLLAELPNTEVKISFDDKRTRLHAKAYYFHRETGFSTAYIGSSNMSNPAMSSGLEWNVKVSEYTSPDLVNKYRASFDTYWYDDEFVLFDPNNQEQNIQLKSVLEETSTVENENVLFFDIKPYPYQQEILEKLEVEREVHQSYKNLIVAATGTGKTIISAFDFKRYYQKNLQATFLFLAHRKEILEQSLMTFRTILRDQNFGELWVEGMVPEKGNHLFASIQTLNHDRKYEEFDPQYFDYIILDETHHSKADSYERILKHFEPQVLLGLTATPERMDGQDILEFFNNRIAAEIRLTEAIDKKLLSPFHYFAVTDPVSLEHLEWQRGGYLPSELSNVYTKDNQRAQVIMESLDRYLTNIEEVKGLGFCVSKEHARYMSNFFNQNGIPSIHLDSDSLKEERNTAQSKLVRGEIKFIFIVDLYNEGVDIPEVNTILFLRPTESQTIFLQQLGRGLRLSENKEVLTVLDYVGQANRNYDFNFKLRAMVGKTKRSMKEEIEYEFPNLPKGCFIQLERVAKEYILTNLNFTAATKNNILRLLREYEHHTDKPLTLANFLTFNNLEIVQLYKVGSFYELCYQANVIDEYVVEDAKEVNNALWRFANVDSKRLLVFAKEFLKRENLFDLNLSNDEKLMVAMLYYTIWDKESKEGYIRSFERLREHNPSTYQEIFEIIDYKLDTLKTVVKNIKLDYSLSLEVHAKYTVDQVLAALGEHTESRKIPFREGVKYIEDKKTDIFFITLNKSEKDYLESTMYEDYAISEQLFHWQSQSRTSIESPTGQRYINHRKTGNTILLFVRENKREHGKTSPYYFLGKGNYVEHNGSKPINIIWHLEEKIPQTIMRETHMKAVVE